MQGRFLRRQGDPFRIGQILQSFVLNAIKITREGASTIEAEGQRLAEDRV